VSDPVVSAAMAVYNGERFVADAVESILSQSVRDLELVIVDDGSTDATPRILDRYARRDSRIVLLRQENRGFAQSLNRAVVAARGPFVAVLDADDVAPPDRLEHQLEYLAEHEAVALVGGAVIFVDGEGRSFAEHRYPTSDAEIRAALELTTPFVHSAVTARRAALLTTGLYRPQFAGAVDTDLWLRLSERFELANLERPVVRYRIHLDQTTSRSLEDQSMCALAARTGWRLRTQGLADPFEDVASIDLAAMVAAGVPESSITEEYVRMATWFAKTLSRAGYEREAVSLFDAAAGRAGSHSGSRQLVADVHRERGKRLDEQGRVVRARLSMFRAALAAKLPRRSTGNQSSGGTIQR
jgi:hypothetical protein